MASASADLTVARGFGTMCGMEKIATDIYTFAELRNEGFTYVVKTLEPKQRITLVGISFSSENRTIVEELVEEVRR